MPAEKHWHVYIIECSDSTFYTGITTDVGRRFENHAAGQGAKYFRFHRPETVVYVESGHTRSTAGKRESEIKRLTRAEKLKLVGMASNHTD